MTDKEREVWDRVVTALEWQKEDSRHLRSYRKTMLDAAIIAISSLLEDDTPERTGWFTAKLNPNDTQRLRRELRSDGIVYAENGLPVELPFSGYCCVEWEDDIGFKVRRYGEWAQAEHEEYGAFAATARDRGDCIDLAIDIATRTP